MQTVLRPSTDVTCSRDRVYRDINLLFCMAKGCSRTGTYLPAAGTLSRMVELFSEENLCIDCAHRETAPPKQCVNRWFTRRCLRPGSFPTPDRTNPAQPTLSLCSRSSYAFIVSGPRRYAHMPILIKSRPLSFRPRLRGGRATGIDVRRWGRPRVSIHREIITFGASSALACA